MTVPAKAPDIRPHFRDQITGRWVLLDSGATACIYPKSLVPAAAPDAAPALKAANGSPITTYGRKLMTFRVGPNNHVKVRCHIADVRNPILGFDWFYANALELRNYRRRGRLHYYTTLNGKRVPLAMSHAKERLGIHAVDDVIGAAHDSYQRWSQQQLVKSTTTADKKQVPRRYARLLADFPDIDKPDFKSQPLATHVIDTGDNRPCTAKVRPLTPGTNKHDLGKKAFDELIKLGVAKRLANDESPIWTSALHLQTKADGSLRPCGDYRLLNQKTHLDGHPLPNIVTFASRLAGSKWFAKCDMTKAYYNVGLDHPSSMKTAVVTPWGTYRFTRLSMGLKNSAQTFQRLVDNVLEGLEVFAYIDDILVYAETEDQLEDKLRQLFGRLRQAGLALNLAKCEFGVNSVDFLGFRVTPTGIGPLPQKTQAIVDFPAPASAKALLGFLGATNYYRRCLPQVGGRTAAAILQPLYEAATAKTPGKKWTDTWADNDLDRHFKAAKELLLHATELAHPDPSAKLVLTTDASLEAMGGVLEQHHRGRYEPLGWWSRHFTPAQRKWSTFRRELYGIHQAIRHFLPAVKGKDFVVFTDHQPIVQAMARSALPEHDPSAVTQLHEIGQWCHDIRHIAGKKNAVSDWLSRPSHVPPPAGTLVEPRPDAIEAVIPAEAGVSTDNDMWRQLALLAHYPADLRTHLARAALDHSSTLRQGVGNPWQGDSTLRQGESDSTATAAAAVEPDWATEVSAAEQLLDPALLAVDQANCTELQRLKGTSNKSLQLAQVTFDRVPLWCNLIDGNPRPFVPAAWRKMLADTFHQLNHPGPEVTATNLGNQYYWPTMKRDVIKWTKSCHTCQAVKANKAVKPPMDHRPVGGRFTEVQCDIVGPLPSSKDMTHLLTICDRATNWQEALPLAAATAQSCVDAFTAGWIASKGIPSKVTCDNGSTFTAGLWTDFHARLGLKVEFTPLYHPQSLGSGERAHKDLKVGLKARLLDMGDTHGTSWMDALPWVLLGRRTCFTPRFGTSSADMVYGQTLQVPGSLLQTATDGTAKVDPAAVLAQLRSKVARAPASTTGLHDRSIYWPTTAASATHVYIKKGSSTITPLGPIKMGPFPILRRVGKSVLDVVTGQDAQGQDRVERHHWENCQPAAVRDGTSPAQRPKRGRPPNSRPPAATTVAHPTPKPPATTTPNPPAMTTPTPPATTAPPPPAPTTRSGRTVKPTRNSNYYYDPIT